MILYNNMRCERMISGVRCACMVNMVCVDAVWCIKVKTKELRLEA